MDKTVEYCPHCDNEVEIDADNPSKCPECKEVILPCSTCYDEKDNKQCCDWTEENRCWRFPYKNKNIEKR